MQQSKKQLFESIYQKHQGMILQMCLGFVKGDSDIANDLFQEINITIWNNLEKFKGTSTYKTWIYRITVNTCLQHIKKESKSNTASLEKVESQLPIEIEVENQNGDVPKLYKAIGQLNELDRLIIMMVLENEEYDDIANVIGISSVNLRVKIHRIKQKLKKILSQ